MKRNFWTFPSNFWTGNPEKWVTWLNTVDFDKSYVLESKSHPMDEILELEASRSSESQCFIDRRDIQESQVTCVAGILCVHNMLDWLYFAA